MKFIGRLFLFTIVLLIVAAIALSYLLPEKQEIKKTITIKATPGKVYSQLLSAQNFTKIFAKADSTIKYKAAGQEGAIGTTISFEDNPFMPGGGQLTLTGLKLNKEITHNVVIANPVKMNAYSKISLNDSDGFTSVTWVFTLLTPRPWNAGNLFYNLEKEKGKDFENGLAALKMASEQRPISRN